jgi:hypothetical protein
MVGVAMAPSYHRLPFRALHLRELTVRLLLLRTRDFSNHNVNLQVSNGVPRDALRKEYESEAKVNVRGNSAAASVSSRMVTVH